LRAPPAEFALAHSLHSTDSVVPSATVRFRYAESLVTASADAVVVRERAD